MDLGVATSHLVTREFLAVVLAGFGNELLPLTGDHGDEPCPKALLPVANTPILDYSLSWVEKSGIRDVLLICPAIHRAAISHHVHSDTSASFSSLRIDLQTYDESQETSVGTCTLLRQFSSRILEDFVLLPCDFIPPPSLLLSALLNKFRTDSMSDGSIATACWFAGHRPGKDATLDEWGPLTPSMSIVWDESSGTLLNIDTPDDIDRNSEELELRMALLSQYPRTKLSSNFQDSHVYVCRRSVLDALHEKRHFDSFREEFLPWLCKVQYQRTKRERYGRVLNPTTNTLSQALALKHSTLNAISHQHTKDSALLHLRSATISVPTSPIESNLCHGTSASLRVGVVIHRAEAGFAARINTIHAFLEMNRQFLAETSYSPSTDHKKRTLVVVQKAQISADSMIGDSTQVADRTSIKTSVIGRHCIIGKMVKITGCVILDHCVVDDGAKLEGCILGKSTKVGAKAELSRCVTQAGYQVDVGETYNNEKLNVSDWTAAPNEEDSALEDDSE